MEPAFVLHRWPYQDSSFIVELLTREQGRYRVVAKGARRSKSPWRAILQPFTPLLVQSRGRHDLQTLTQAELNGRAVALNGRSLYSGFYLNELVQRLTSPYQPLEPVFDDYQQALVQLASSAHVEPVLRQFEWQMLCHLGHGFDWDYDDQGESIQGEFWYRFVPEHGFCRVPQATTDCFSGSSLLQLGAFELSDPRLLNSMKRIMRMALAPYLGDQPLRSRQLFAQQKGN